MKSSKKVLSRLLLDSASIVGITSECFQFFNRFFNFFEFFD